jgi:hypothetical protein
VTGLRRPGNTDDRRAAKPRGQISERREDESLYLLLRFIFTMLGDLPCRPLRGRPSTLLGAP